MISLVEPPPEHCPGTGTELSGTIFSVPDPHKEMPPGSGSAWIDADPGGKKSLENILLIFNDFLMHRPKIMLVLFL